MFKYLININPLGFMYGSAGAFLSPENLVGRSGSKFPPEAATLSGLFFRVNESQKLWDKKELSNDLYVAGPFWRKWDALPENFYVPIPWNKIIAQDESCEWKIKDQKWYSENPKLKPYYQWQKINSWNDSAELIQSNGYAEKSPWKFVSVLHPRLKDDERCTLKIDDQKGGLFLEYSVQMDPECCLVYLSTHELPEGWYRFGGENHIVEVTSFKLDHDSHIVNLLNEPIKDKFALITPGVWGSTRLSQRCPQNEFFPNHEKIQMLTDKPVPFRYSIGDKEKKRGRLGRGRYAVPSGSVYVLEKSIGKPWWDWDEKWFPVEGFSLKKMGCGLCLPIDI